jgi:hypothetical protein
MRLTEAQQQTLQACQDWSAPYEVAYRRHDLTGDIIDLGGQCSVLGRLRNLGLVEYAMCNDTFRITPAGRLALTSGSKPE